MTRRTAPPVKHDDPGMIGQRSRNNDGTLRQKRADTHAGTIEDMYGIDLGVRSDKQLGNILKDEGVTSLTDLIEKKRSE